MLRARMVELEGANRSLAKEAYGWRMRYEQLSRGQPPQPPQPGAALQQGSAVYALPTPERRVCCRICGSVGVLCFHYLALIRPKGVSPPHCA